MSRGMKKRVARLTAAGVGRWVLPALALAMGVVITAGPAVGQADPGAAVVKDLLGASNSLGLDWARLFDDSGRSKDEIDAAGSPGANGVPDYVDWYGGIDGCAIEDKISGGQAVDMSALGGGPGIAQCTVHNGVVAQSHDQGNSYMYATLNSVGDLVVYLGVERLYSAATTHLELELNQARVRVKSGAPWPVNGTRTENDLLIRVDYSLGAVSAVEVKRWALDGGGAGSFQTVGGPYGGLDASSCNGTPTVCLFCAGPPPIAAQQEAWDAAGNALAAIPPDDFFEVGVNVGALLGANVEYTAIQVRTPEDIALGSFLAIGHWSN